MIHNTVFEGKESQINALSKLKAQHAEIAVFVPLRENDRGPWTANVTFSEVTSFHRKGLQQEERRPRHWQDGDSFSSQKSLNSIGLETSEKA